MSKSWEPGSSQLSSTASTAVPASSLALFELLPRLPFMMAHDLGVCNEMNPFVPQVLLAHGTLSLPRKLTVVLTLASCLSLLQFHQEVDPY